jgi:hypothetical protein
MLQHDTSTSVGEIRGYITWFTKTDDEPTSFTSAGSEADSPEPLLRPSPATDHDAEKLDVYDPDLGYDAENFHISSPNGG